MAVERYAAFLRGVMPTNAKMPDLKRAFEAAGFTEVRTILGSGNVVFSSPAANAPALERRVEAAMEKTLGRAFDTLVRRVDRLRELLAADPFASFRLPRDVKRVVTFLREPPKAAVSLPLEVDGARILGIDGCEVFTAYSRSPKGPVFMTLIQKTFGSEVTTRTWETIQKVVAAGLSDEDGSPRRLRPPSAGARSPGAGTTRARRSRRPG